MKGKGDDFQMLRIESSNTVSTPKISKCLISWHLKKNRFKDPTIVLMSIMCASIDGLYKLALAF